MESLRVLQLPRKTLEWKTQYIYILNSLPHPLKTKRHNVLTDLAKAWKELRKKKSAVICRSKESENKPFHHFNIKAESLVDGVCPSPDTRLELEHFRWTQNQSILHKVHKESLIQHDKLVLKSYYTRCSETEKTAFSTCLLPHLISELLIVNILVSLSYVQ